MSGYANTGDVVSNLFINLECFIMFCILDIILLFLQKISNGFCILGEV
jgi:hypothetical protein